MWIMWITYLISAIHLCGLFVAFVDFYTLLFLKSTGDVVLLSLHVDSISISTVVF